MHRATCLGVVALGLSCASLGLAQPVPEPPGVDNSGLIELRFTPTARAQIALWIERGDGEFLRTVRLTEAVAYRGLGNRPGASQMNSGFRWPYGRREAALPIWARARASAPGARLWKRVIFQNRKSEGDASRTVEDSTADDYYCLSFTQTRADKDALDAVSCATQFYSDKGRFMTEEDLLSGYAEPFQDLASGMGRMRPLSLTSLYPPRRDVMRCRGNCLDHPDVDQLAAHAREVMPEIDAITMATPTGGTRKEILFAAPVEWQPGAYRACLEINVEGDHNQGFSQQAYPTPTQPEGGWDRFARTWGYPFRGQPSVVYCADISLGAETEQRFTLDEATGSAATWDVEGESYGEIRGMEGMTDDPIGSPGSGADRLALMEDGHRLEIIVRPPLMCSDNSEPELVEELSVSTHGERKHAHEWAELRFRAADDDQGIFAYEVRFSTQPITDAASFMRAEPAKNASAEAEELRLPTGNEAGTPIASAIGGLAAQTHYYVGVRAVDGCAVAGPVAVAELTTPARRFATVSPCFVATAAWGTPLAREIGALRRLRDRHLLTSEPGRALVGLYHQHGPKLARLIEGDEDLRALARAVLSPLVALAELLED